ncbi:MAG: sensor histidine kinase, partial [Waterburya sp.]
FQSFDLHQLLANLAKMFKLRALEKNIRLTFNLPNNLPQNIETDPVKLKQILINLIDNGIKFTDQGGVTLNLKLLTESNQTMLAFAIIDTGQGILPSHLESIFVPFVQTKQSEQQGTGLGLAICQQFARLLGGEITVSSRLGEGSLFKFQIPITVVQPQATLTIQQPVKNFNFSPEQEQKIATLDLTNMSTEWIKQLHQAAIAIDSELILQLIKQIPATEPDLTAGLIRMLKNFEYDEMVELIERSWM